MSKNKSNVFGSDPNKQSSVLMSQLINWLYSNSKLLILKSTDVTETKGVFRESGNYTKIKEWTEKYNKNSIIPLNQDVSFCGFQTFKAYSVEDVSGIFLHFYHSLPNPFIEIENVEEYCKLLGFISFIYLFEIQRKEMKFFSIF
jgi:hypothetical protein